METAYRRHVLALLGLASTALAGCSALEGDDESDLGVGDEADEATDDEQSRDEDGASDEDDDSAEDDGSQDALSAGGPPTYAGALPDRSAYGTEVFESDLVGKDTFVVAIDLETVRGAVDDDPGEGTAPADPLLTNAVAAISLGVFGMFALGASPVGGVHADAEQPAEGTPTLCYLDGAYVFVGSYDLEMARSELEAAGYDDVSPDADRAIFTDQASSEVVGVTEAAFVYASGSTAGGDAEAREAVVAAITDASAEADLALGESGGPIERALDSTPETGITTLLAGGGDQLRDLEETESTADPENDVVFDLAPFEGALAVTQTVGGESSEIGDGDGGEGAGGGDTARAVGYYEDVDSVDIQGLEETLDQGDAESMLLETRGDAVLVRASYGSDVAD